MFDSCPYASLMAMTRQVAKLWDDEFGKLGLTPTDGYILKLTIEKPCITQKEISEILDFPPWAVTRSLNYLQEEGLSKRVCCSNDARAMSVSATKKGLNLGQKIDETLRRLNEQIQARLGERGVKGLVDTLQQGRKKFVTETLQTK